MGPYEVVGELARGGMGVVHVARDPAGREVALKVLHVAPGPGMDELEARFRREGEVLARLQVPGVVRVHALGRDGERWYLAMDLLEGESLRRRLAREGPFDAAAAVGIVAQAARALAAVHAAGVLHRDLKPDNVLLLPDGRAVLIDFGLARGLGPDASRRLTQTGEVLGTPAYMAPEQAAGDPAAVGVATDVYGLGATLYALLTGRAPFTGATTVNVLSAVLEQPPVPPSRLRPGLPPGLDAVCLRCLEKRPARRYPTAEALAIELEGLGREGRLETPRAPPRRRPAVVAAVALGALGLVAAFGGLHVHVGRRAAAREAWLHDAEAARGVATRAASTVARAARACWLLGDAALAAARAEALTGALADVAAAQSTLTALAAAPPAGVEAERVAALAVERAGLAAERATGEVVALALAGRTREALDRLADVPDDPRRALLSGWVALVAGERGATEQLADLAGSTGLPPAVREDAALLAARGALDAGDVGAARRALGLRTPGTDSLADDATRWLEGRLRVRVEEGPVLAEEGRRLAGSLDVAAVDRLREACARGAPPEVAAEAARAALDRWAQERDTRRTRRFLEALRAAFPGVAFPSDVTLPHLAVVTEQLSSGGDPSQLPETLAATYALDPGLAFPAELATETLPILRRQVSEERWDEASALALSLTRLSVDVRSENAAALYASGVLDGASERARGEWAYQALLGRAAYAYSKTHAREDPEWQVAVRRSLAALDFVLGAPDAPLLARTDAVWRRLNLLGILDPAGHAERVEAALRDNPDPAPVYRVAVDSGGSTDARTLPWARGYVDATRARVLATRSDTLPPGMRPVTDEAEELDSAYRRLVAALLAVGEGAPDTDAERAALDEADARIEELARDRAATGVVLAARVEVLRANVLLRRGRPADALVHLERALSLDPRHRDALYLRAVALESLGDPRAPEARRAYEDVVRAGGGG